MVLLVPSGILVRDWRIHVQLSLLLTLAGLHLHYLSGARELGRIIADDRSNNPPVRNFLGQIERRIDFCASRRRHRAGFIQANRKSDGSSRNVAANRIRLPVQKASVVR